MSTAMAVPSPHSHLDPQAQHLPQTHTQPLAQQQAAQRPVLSVDIQQPALTQTQLSFPPTMPPKQSKMEPTSPSRYKTTADELTAPPHSPISPKGIAAKLASMKPYKAPQVLQKPPPPVPIAESDNPDAIALRSALMILQVQRESARRDIRELQQLKEEAVRDPEAYVQELVKRSKGVAAVDSRVSGGAVQEDLLAPTMRYLVDGLGEQSDFLRSVESNDTEMGDSSRQQTNSKDKADDDISDSQSDSESKPKARFAAMPKAQNIYRMPPVNWAKYQLAGAGLEKLHHDQQVRPTAGQPVDPALLAAAGSGASERYVMAAPYEPVLDAARLGHPSDHPMQTRRKGNRK